MPAALHLAPPAPHPSSRSVFIAICAKLGLLRAAEFSTYDTEDVAAGMQNFLIWCARRGREGRVPAHTPAQSHGDRTCSPTCT